MLNYNPLNKKELDETVEAIFEECEQLDKQKEKEKQNKIRLNAIQTIKPKEALDLWGKTFLWICIIVLILSLLFVST